MKQFVVSVCVGLLGQCAAAQGYIADNHSWTLTCNADGYVMTSNHPVARFFENGAASRVTEEIETLFLGKSCDAFDAAFGDGSWCWANGGFLAEFMDHRLAFSRQELSCGEVVLLDLNCGC